MINKNILRTARKFVHRELKGPLTFSAVEKYLNRCGYTVLFYGAGENMELIQKYELAEYSKTCNAFTVNDDSDKFVFIKSELSAQDMMYSLLHETGHIILKHLDERHISADRTTQEIEADTFAYHVINHTDTPYIIGIGVVCLIASAVIKHKRGTDK